MRNISKNKMKSHNIHRRGLVAGTVCFSIALVFGCGSPKPKSDHSHIWVGEESHNVWTYQRAILVDAESGEEQLPKEFLKMELKPDQTILFESGDKATFDGARLRIGAKVVETKHVHLESNGMVRPNAFIRSSK